MSKPKIDLVKLDKLLRQGMSYREIAKEFSCTPGAISQARKKLSVDIVKNVLHKSTRVLEILLTVESHVSLSHFTYSLNKQPT